MVQSYARQFDGQDWANVVPYIKKFMPAMGLYLLMDGSLARIYYNGTKRLVQHCDDGIRIRQENRSFQS